MQHLGNILAATVYGLIFGVAIRLAVEQRTARRKGARLAPHVRDRERVPCTNHTCRRLFWSDHGWQPPTTDELYCSPECIPTHRKATP